MTGTMDLSWMRRRTPAPGKRTARFCESTDFGALSQQISTGLASLLVQDVPLRPLFIKALMGLDHPGHVVHIQPITPSRLGLHLEADIGYWPSIADALDSLASETTVYGGPVISGFIRRSDKSNCRSVDVQLRSNDAQATFTVTQAVPVGDWKSTVVAGSLREAL
jgi:hypothetical protein